MVAPEVDNGNDQTVTVGLAKSGRWWKPSQDTRFSNIKKDKPLRSTWDQKMKARAEKKSIKEYSKRLQDEKRRERIEYWDRVKAHRVKKEENRKNSEVVQVIKNTKKIKRLKKKQLRQIEKRDITGVKTKKMLPTDTRTKK
ncbi:coiled-coil domain-containing protein 86-like [Styela clava]|uniref:coiled-coil domain-containing protein 86-like n=1 Tax=Styela clava TaxID=7725 RepID=UPI00193A456C|nr:coiled-coil domain-containing protein 86-like [Styela clava]